jgi:hypothetical protein
MPVMDGITLLKRVKKSGSHTPSVIFISGFSDIETRNAYDLGAEAFLEKPIAREDLIHSVQRSLAERKELWQTPLDPDSFPVLTGSFESVAAALHECKLAFGRGGFCIRTEQSLREGRVNIRLNFKTDAFVVSGQGIVRWVAPQEHLAGIEIVYLSEESRAGVLRLMEPSISFIPGTTGRVYQVQTA